MAEPTFTFRDTDIAIHNPPQTGVMMPSAEHVNTLVGGDTKFKVSKDKVECFVPLYVNGVEINPKDLNRGIWKVEDHGRILGMINADTKQFFVYNDTPKTSDVQFNITFFDNWVCALIVFGWFIQWVKGKYELGKRIQSMEDKYAETCK